MDITIRQARIEDAAAITTIKDAVWSGESAERERIASVIASGEHSTFIAEWDGQIAGFVDSFTTRSATNVARWEVDLLAVHPGYQGRGMGWALVNAATQAGRESGAAFARALIQTGNIPSQRTFARCGYECDIAVHNLYIAAHPAPERQGGGVSANLIGVQTFNYSGLWVEPPLDRFSLQVALGAVQSSVYDLAGVLIPATDQPIIHIAQGLGYRQVAAFQWWRLNFNG
ncbi:MAG: GNAT family N-acetyltransferase [Anaerolineaceae bacterium]|nr:GNAT family N-acetyltransferase [Anaerolineaceae bacterium]